jgi:hypothetical protein
VRKNPKTECKKFFRNENASLEMKQQTLQRLMFWCMNGPTFARQRSHIAFTPAHSDCPPVAFLLARKIGDARAYADCVHDDDLDAAMVPLDILPPASWDRCAELQASAVGGAAVAAPAVAPGPVAVAVPVAAAAAAVVPAAAAVPARGRGAAGRVGRAGRLPGRVAGRGHARGRAPAIPAAGVAAAVPAAEADAGSDSTDNPMGLDSPCDDSDSD